jgi:hypothetical protein
MEVPRALPVGLHYRSSCSKVGWGRKIKATSKNVIPAKAGIHKLLTLLDSRLRGSDKLGIIRGSHKSYEQELIQTS